MATIDYPLERPEAQAREFSFSEALYSWVATVDHKRLGLMYVISALLFFVVSGIMAAVIRLQLMFPNSHVVGPDTYNRLFTMHGTTMVFLVGMPMVAGFSNYLVPIMIGARDMAFPRLNAWGFWIFLFGGLLLYYSYIGGGGLSGAGSAPDIGWFAYAPLTTKTFSRGSATDYWALGIMVAGLGSIASAINVIATCFSMRCPGMTLSRMPMFVWVMLIDSWLIIVALPPHSRRADHAGAGPPSGCQLLRDAGGRFGGPLAASFLDFRPSGSLHIDLSGLRDSVGGHSGLFAGSRFLAVLQWWARLSQSGSSALAFGRTTCSRSE